MGGPTHLLPELLLRPGPLPPQGQRGPAAPRHRVLPTPLPGTQPVWAWVTRRVRWGCWIGAVAFRMGVGSEVGFVWVQQIC